VEEMKKKIPKEHESDYKKSSKFSQRSESDMDIDLSNLSSCDT
jgi:hypothetical protein